MPLTRDEVEAMLRAIFALPPTRLELPDLISTLTEGNPFFVEELLFGHIARTIASYVSPPVGVKPAALWGTEERVRELFGEGIASLQATRRKTPEGRCGTPEDLIGAAIF